MTDIRYGVDEIRSFPPGLDPFKTRAKDMPRAGDFFLTHQKDKPIFPPAFALIRLGQRLRYRGKDKPFAFWNHAGVFVDDKGEMVEALNSGVVGRNITAYKPEEFTVVYLDMTDTDREQVARCAKAHIGMRYGWLNIVNIGMRLVFGGKLSYSVPDQPICSGLVARCLQAAGYTWRGYDTNRMMPADLAWLANVSSEDFD